MKIIEQTTDKEGCLPAKLTHLSEQKEKPIFTLSFPQVGMSVTAQCENNMDTSVLTSLLIQTFKERIM